jgi:holin-like protein
MISGLVILFVCQLLGEGIAILLNLPIPGPVIGMILLFAGLLVTDQSPETYPDKLRSDNDQVSTTRFPGLEKAAQGILEYLALMFVPAGTGIITYMSLIQAEGLALTLTLIISTALTLVVTGGVLQLITKNRSRPGAPEENLT